MKSVCCRSTVVFVLLAMSWLGCSKPPSAPPAAAGSTDLVIEVSGGFAYIPTPADNKLEIAYLKDTKVTGCDVDQIGTNLLIEEGTVVEPASAKTQEFDLARAVVTFPDLESAPGALVAVRGDRPGPPYTPQNPAEAGQWHDLKWIPRISDQYSSSLNPDWRNMVDGRVVLKGGSIRAMQPADLVVQNNLFEFRKGSTPVFRQALTDRTEYSVRVPANRVTLHLSGAQSGVSRIVIAPLTPGGTVKLKLMGRHAHSTPPTLTDGDRIVDYCAFYQLMQPVPAESEWLIPHFVRAAATTGPGAGSPGLFCVGDWF